MENNIVFSAILMFLVPLVVLLLPVWLGQRYGRSAKKKLSDINEEPISSAVAASLGLLAFMLAFTFQIASIRYDARRELLLNEVLDIRSTYLYAGLIPEPFRTNARKQLIDYVDIRVELARDDSKLNTTISSSQQILDSLWASAEALAAQDRSSEAYSLFTASVNQLVVLFKERVTVSLQYRMPPVILFLLGFITFFSMVIFGYQFGVSGRMHILVVLFLAINFASVMWLIFALDRPQMGLIPLNQAPLYTLHEQLHQNK
jgi:hypothetical protein